MTQPERLGVGIRLGIGIGGLTASTCYLVGSIPILGHATRFVGDIHRGALLGWEAQMSLIKHREEEKMAQERTLVPA